MQTLKKTELKRSEAPSGHRTTKKLGTVGALNSTSRSDIPPKSRDLNLRLMPSESLLMSLSTRFFLLLVIIWSWAILSFSSADIGHCKSPVLSHIMVFGVFTTWL